jgi:transketolase
VTGHGSDLTIADFTSKDQRSTERKSPYGTSLVEAARQDPRIVCLTADLSVPTETDLFRDVMPERFHQVGIAEANMIGIAGGMARAGDVPFVHTFSVFATRRCYDQIAMQVAYPRTNVKIVGFLPGLTTPLGVSHQAIDDLALMRALPHMTVIEPNGAGQIPAAVAAAASHRGPVYLRIGRVGRLEGEAAPDAELRVGKVIWRRRGMDGLVIASGVMVHIALRAAERLAREGISLAIIDSPTIKPLDPTRVEECRRQPFVITAENHSVIGGLGSAVAELLMERGVNVPFHRVGVRDVFAEGGSTPYLFEKYGLSEDAIISTVNRFAGRDDD